MLNREALPGRVYYKMSEVAEMLNLTTSAIRFWQENFKFPLHRNKRNQRRFTVDQLKNVFAVWYLLCIERYTIKGAMIKYQAWLDGKYKIPENYLEIPDGFTLNVIDDILEYPKKGS